MWVLGACVTEREKSTRRRFSNGALHAAGLCTSQSWGRSLDYVQFQRIFISPSARKTRKKIFQEHCSAEQVCCDIIHLVTYLSGALALTSSAATHYTQILSLLASFDFIIRFVNIYKICGSSAAASPGFESMNHASCPAANLNCGFVLPNVYTRRQQHTFGSSLKSCRQFHFLRFSAWLRFVCATNVCLSPPHAHSNRKEFAIFRVFSITGGAMLWESFFLFTPVASTEKFIY